MAPDKPCRLIWCVATGIFHCNIHHLEIHIGSNMKTTIPDFRLPLTSGLRSQPWPEATECQCWLEVCAPGLWLWCLNLEGCGLVVWPWCDLDWKLYSSSSLAFSWSPHALLSSLKLRNCCFDSLLTFVSNKYDHPKPHVKIFLYGFNNYYKVIR